MEKKFIGGRSVEKGCLLSHCVRWISSLSTKMYFRLPGVTRKKGEIQYMLSQALHRVVLRVVAPVIKSPGGLLAVLACLQVIDHAVKYVDGQVREGNAIVLGHRDDLTVTIFAPQ
jgi:hypothetical protein